MNRKRGKNGQWKPQYSEKTIMPLLTEDWQDTKTIAQKAGCTTRKILQVLNPLVEAGKVEKKTVGNALIWKKPEPYEKSE